jgi:transposase
MVANDVKDYVKRNKNDAADAAAICEAVRRPTMRFVRIMTLVVRSGRKFAEQCLRLSQIERVKAVRERSLDGRKQIARLDTLSLVTPELGERGDGFPKLSHRPAHILPQCASPASLTPSACSAPSEAQGDSLSECLLPDRPLRTP